MLFVYRKKTRVIGYLTIWRIWEVAVFFELVQEVFPSHYFTKSSYESYKIWLYLQKKKS